METQEYLNKTHKVLKEILDYVVKVCEENGFTYFLAYGTALGSYRHQGFIPWDDDIDISLPRDDFDAFIEYMKSHEDPDYRLQYYHNEKNYFLMFPKVRKSGTYFGEEIVAGLYDNNGFFIDIFPMEYVTEENVKKVKANNRRYVFYNHILKFRACRAFYQQKESTLRFFIDRIFAFFYKNVSNEMLIKKLHETTSRDGNKENGSYIAEYDERLIVLPKDAYFPPQKMEFEGTLYNMPNRAQDYLEAFYGADYMELPPEEERITHKPLEVRF